MQGIVIRAHSSQCLVASGGRTWRCRLRGRLKQGRRREQTVAVVGDHVGFRELPGEGGELPAGIIEEIGERRNRISRRAARRSGGRVEQVLMANLDQVVAVQSILEPAPVAGFVDRLLVAAERFGVRGVLCLNKCDLDDEAARDGRWDHYDELGYELVRTSAETGRGLEDLSTVLSGGISLLLGASGVGKSSLLNAIHPELGLRIGPVTARTGLGRHTTTRTELFPLPGGGYIADSPGIRGFDPWDIAPEDLRDYFPEFDEPGRECRFRTCVHRDEPSCGVKDACRAGRIPVWRHEAYLLLLSDLESRRDEPGAQGRTRR